MILYLLLLINYSVANFYYDNQDPFEDRWSWGPVNENEVLTSRSDRVDPCLPLEDKQPDFSKPGRRISEVKCYEYVWDIKHRQDQLENEHVCSHNKSTAKGIYPTIGVEDVSVGEFPHMAAIGWKSSSNDTMWVFKCGGSLISSKFVLTAAHCTKATSRDTTISDVDPKIVRLGKTNVQPEFNDKIVPVDAIIKRSIVHYRYKSPRQFFNIALLELEQAVEFSLFIHPACLWHLDEVNVQNKAIITGWGVVNSAKPETAKTLQRAAVDLIDSRTCTQLLRRNCKETFCGVGDHQICSGLLTGGVDTCQDDSGGPVQTRIPLPKRGFPSAINAHIYHIIGITTFGFGCGRPNTPAPHTEYVSYKHTRVSSFVDWIEGIVWPSN